MEKAQGLDTFLKKMGKSIKVKDLNNRIYLIDDIEQFISHINEYHAHGVSIHEENGFFFQIDDLFREKIKKLSTK
tara:strand:+ start:47 stop:271 length:225 start_codon:yes stop_codon:yes gene_type:complete